LVVNNNNKSNNNNHQQTDEKQETKQQSPRGRLGLSMVVRERNVVSVQVRPNRPQLLYSRTYVGMQPGRCLEYNIDQDTSLLTRDQTFKDFLERPYTIIPQGEKKYLLIVPKWTGFKAGWLSHKLKHIRSSE
jgi:hypothetical protein